MLLKRQSQQLQINQDLINSMLLIAYIDKCQKKKENPSFYIIKWRWLCSNFISNFRGNFILLPNFCSPVVTTLNSFYEPFKSRIDELNCLHICIYNRAKPLDFCFSSEQKQKYWSYFLKH